MSDKPILFSGPMVRAILDGRKTQTRRIVFGSQVSSLHASRGCFDASGYDTVTDAAIVRVSWTALSIATYLRCPYAIGDSLWVRETWWEIPEPSLRQLRDGADTWPKVAYDADESDICREQNRAMGWRLRPSIHMPRWASRIRLEVTEVRVQRLRDISEDDARAEAIRVLPLQSENDPSAWWQSEPGVNQARTPRGSFAMLWDSINGKRPGCAWADNPWVWAYTFRRLEAR